MSITDRMDGEMFAKLVFTFIYRSVIFVIVIGLAYLFSNAIPFDFFHFWTSKGSFMEVVKTSWVLFAWAVGGTLLIKFVFGGGSLSDPEESLGKGLLISVWAGIAEEIMFRWLWFYAAIVITKIVNFFIFDFGGWGFGVTEWMSTTIFWPLANWITLGHLAPFVSGFGWAVCSAIMISNGKFRNGHAYQGILGWINSWFLGMCFFYIMFKHGLPAAMFVHFFYDALIFLTSYIISVFERMGEKKRRMRRIALDTAPSSIRYQ